MHLSEVPFIPLQLFFQLFNRHIKKMLVNSHHRLVHGRRLLLIYRRGPYVFRLGLVPLALSFVGTALAANYGCRVYVIFAKSVFSDS